MNSGMGTLMMIGAEGAAHSAGAGPGWLALVPLLPLLACVLCGLTMAFRVRTKLPAWIVVGSLGVSFALTVAGFMGWDGHAGQVIHIYEWIGASWGSGPGQSFSAQFGFYMDGLSWLWMLFVTGLATLIALYASEYMGHDVGKGYGRFFSAFALFVFSMACLVMADNLVLLYLGWEGVGLCSYLLIGYFYTKPSAVAAAKKAFIVNRIGDFGLALGIFLIYVTFGTVQYDELFRMVDAGVAGDGTALAGAWQSWAIPMLLMVGAFGKSAQLPLYVWLPDAMEGPTPVSALIHAATMVTAGVYLIARTMPLFQLDDQHTALTIVAWVGTLTALLAATIGMAQFDIKRIMAYSTVSQLGYMFAGLGVLTSTGAAFHVFTHAFFKALLFLACGAVMHGFAGQLDLRKLSGVQRMPGWRIVGFTMLVGCLNLSGFPLITSGYFSKDMILAQAFTTPGEIIAGSQWIGWILLITAGLTAYYTFRVYFRVFVGPEEFEPGDELHGHDDHDHGHDHHAHGGHDDHGHENGHSAHAGHGHGEFHPHPPGWAINSVLVILALLSFAAIPTYFMYPEDHGWVGHMVHGSTAVVESPGAHHADAHAADSAAHAGTFLGFDPHAVMYYVSAVFGFVGILIAAFLHGPVGLGGLMLGSRTEAERSRADGLLPLLGPIPRWAQHKWYVDEFYDMILRTPLWVLANIFHIFDKLVIDGLVDLCGKIPQWLAAALRPSQNGQLHGYAAGMAGGLVVILLIVLIVMGVG
jgi:NADH-quinone oxidoreductase subunit L